MIVILDYAAGNQTSVCRALEYLDIPCVISDKADILQNASGIIFPGVGAAARAMHYLRTNGLDKLLYEAIERQIPLLGICLGCQILLEASEEDGGTVGGTAEGTAALGLIPGICRRFDDKLKDEEGAYLRIPHMGWNNLKIIKTSPLLEGIKDSDQFYFVHSYFACPPKDMVLATTHYGLDFCSVYGQGVLWATQFHPEKSGEPGLQILRNFFALTKEGGKC